MLYYLLQLTSFKFLDRQIYVPIHTGDHWLLLIVRVHDRVVEIWDSMLHEGRSTGYPFVADVVISINNPVFCS